MSIYQFIAIVSTLGVLAVEGVSVTRQKQREVLILPPDITNEILENESIKTMIAPLPSGHIQCLEGKDRFCTKSMAAIKQTLKKAMVDDCATCSEEEKSSAGFVLASLLFYHSETWSRMLSRYQAAERYQRYLSPEMERASRQRRFFDAGRPALSLPDSIDLRTQPSFKSSYKVLY